MTGRMTFRSLLLLAAIALVGLAVVSACGGDDEDRGRSNRTPTIDIATAPLETDISRTPSGGQSDGSGTPPAEGTASQSSPAERTAEAIVDATEEAADEAADATEDAQDAIENATDEAQDRDDGDGGD